MIAYLPGGCVHFSCCGLDVGIVPIKIHSGIPLLSAVCTSIEDSYRRVSLIFLNYTSPTMSKRQREDDEWAEWEANKKAKEEKRERDKLEWERWEREREEKKAQKQHEEEM